MRLQLQYQKCHPGSASVIVTDILSGCLAVIMTTFDLINRSELLLAPAKNNFKSHNRTSQGTELIKGTANGKREMPLVTTLARIGMGILALTLCKLYLPKYGMDASNTEETYLR